MRSPCADPAGPSPPCKCPLRLAPPRPAHPVSAPQVQAQVDAYAARYHALKVPRKLVWRPGLGQVTLEVTLGEQSLEFTVGGREGPDYGAGRGTELLLCLACCCLPAAEFMLLGRA